MRETSDEKVDEEEKKVVFAAVKQLDGQYRHWMMDGSLGYAISVKHYRKLSNTLIPLGSQVR